MVHSEVLEVMLLSSWIDDTQRRTERQAEILRLRAAGGTMGIGE